MSETKKPIATSGTNLGVAAFQEVCDTCGSLECPSRIEAGQCFYCIARQFRAERDAAKGLCDTLASALDSIAKWNLPEHYELDYGSNGARGYIKGVAERALVEWRAAK